MADFQIGSSEMIPGRNPGVYVENSREVLLEKCQESAGRNPFKDTENNLWKNFGRDP